MPDPITYLDRVATVIETVTDGSRGAADCVLSVSLTNGAWEMDIAMLADFGLTPVVGMELSVDIEEADKISDGLPNGRSVTVVGLRAI